ncbi:MAG: RagB/SusD family nutrient uptake outer membrane protein [Bacteroidota bacterium]|nr:RagB/SusD family nutrient uptake outer membrane protein [Bacteroidota bacterium]
MKKLLYIITMSVLFLTSSCEKYLDQTPEGEMTEEYVYNSKNSVLSEIAHCYSYIPNLVLNYGFAWWATPSAGWSVLSGEADTPFDNYWSNSVTNGNWNANSGYPNDYWTFYYQSFRTIHNFMNKVHPISGLSEKDVENAKLEVRFLRAYYYALLLEQYGAVPLILEEVPLTSKDLPVRTPYDQTVTWLDNELKELAGKLPTVNNSTTWDYGKPTKGAALAVRARVLLYAASPLYNGNSDLAALKNPDGTSLYNSNYDKEKWKKAMEASKELIDLAESGTYNLYKEYNDDGSIDPFMSLKNLFFNVTDNKEVIFSRTYVQDFWDEWGKVTAPMHIWGYGGLSPTQESVDAFYTKDGKDIHDDPSYTETGYSTEDAYVNSKWNDNGEAGLITKAGTYNMYINREPRFYLSVSWCGSICANDLNPIDFIQGHGSEDAKQARNGSLTGYLVKKMTDNAFHPWLNSTAYRPLILYRLAEVYLNYAEALNEYQPGNQDILKYVNLVRQRAGIPDLPSSVLSDPIKMRAAILKERQNEFYCEDGIRYFDIMRWKLGETLLNGDFHGMDVWADSEENFFKRTAYEKRVFPKKYYFFPIPLTEIEKNKNLVQNPGW